MKKTLFLLTLSSLFCAGLIAHPPGVAQEKAPGVALQVPKDDTIVITSQTLQIDDTKKTIRFLGDVNAATEDFRLECENMTILYSESPDAADISTAEVRKITATGRVKITREDGATATADEAEYFQAEEKVVLTGNPQLKQGPDLVEGNKVTLFLKENRSIVEGSSDRKVRAVLSPGKGKR